MIERHLPKTRILAVALLCGGLGIFQAITGASAQAPASPDAAPQASIPALAQFFPLALGKLYYRSRSDSTEYDMVVVGRRPDGTDEATRVLRHGATVRSTRPCVTVGAAGDTGESVLLGEAEWLCLISPTQQRLAFARIASGAAWPEQGLLVETAGPLLVLDGGTWKLSKQGVAWSPAGLILAGGLQIIFDDAREEFWQALPGKLRRLSLEGRVVAEGPFPIPPAADFAGFGVEATRGWIWVARFDGARPGAAGVRDLRGMTVTAFDLAGVVQAEHSFPGPGPYRFIYDSRGERGWVSGCNSVSGWTTEKPYDHEIGVLDDPARRKQVQIYSALATLAPALHAPGGRCEALALALEYGSGTSDRDRRNNNLRVLGHGGFASISSYDARPSLYKDWLFANMKPERRKQ